MQQRGENISNYITWEVKSSRQTASPRLPLVQCLVVVVVVVVLKIFELVPQAYSTGHFKPSFF